MERKNLKKLKGLLYGMGLGVMTLSLSGCRPDSPKNVKKYLVNNQYNQSNVGFLKLGEQRIPYYKYDQKYIAVAWGYYHSNTGDYIGDVEENNVVSDDSILYSSEQVIPFVECNPNVEYNYAAIQAFTEETYQNLEESYFLNHAFSASEIGIYEVLNLTTADVKYVIGRKVSGTQVFDFESYKLEDYTGYAIKDMEVEFEQKAYYYSEILEIIKSYRENEKGMILERK